ncbi:MAG: hypothetical protein PHV33_01135 [Elusimicrobiales bacterium]|nr:hypothetical protein [Elusimicrobiales bacterium]
MDKAKLGKAYFTAAVVSAGIFGAVFLYAVVGEMLRHFGHKPPLQPPAAYAVKYALYLLSASSLLIVRLAAAKFSERKPTPEATLKALTTGAIVTAAACEVPGVSALVLLLLTGSYPDFYLLLAFSAALEVYHFPRLPLWEERLRGEGHL